MIGDLLFIDFFKFLSYRKEEKKENQRQNRLSVDSAA